MSEDDPFGGPDGLVPDEPGAGDASEAAVLPEVTAEPAPDAGPAEEYHRRARLAEDRLSEVLTAYRQVRTENDGFRERITRNVERRFDQRRERLLLKFIDILDNLDRALEAAEQSYAGNPLIEGLILVRSSLLQTLQEEGLERIPVLGMPYDPNFSEAVATQPVEDPDHHHVVVKEMLRGYRLNGRVARASRVLVGEYGHVEPTPAEPEPLIGADEVPADDLGLEPEALSAEPSLEELVAGIEGEPTLVEEDEIAEAQLPELDPEETQEPTLLSEEDFALGDPVLEPLPEPAPKKPRPRGE